MVLKVLQRAAFIGGRLFQAGDEVDVATTNPNVLIPASSSPIGNLTLAEVAVFLRYKAEEAGEDLEALIFPEAEAEAVANAEQPVLVRAADPIPTEFNTQVTPAEGRLDTVDGVIVADEPASDGGGAFVPFEKRTKAELIDYLGADSPAPDGATKATLIEAAEKKHAAQAG